MVVPNCVCIIVYVTICYFSAHITREYEYLLPMRLLRKPIPPLQGLNNASSADANRATDDVFSGCDWRYVISDPITGRPASFPNLRDFDTSDDFNISIGSISSSASSNTSGSDSSNVNHRVESYEDIIARFDAQLANLVGPHR
jgi:hypothetical protein